jgi:hypothetical protein
MLYAVAMFDYFRFILHRNEIEKERTESSHFLLRPFTAPWNIVLALTVILFSLDAIIQFFHLWGEFPETVLGIPLNVFNPVPLLFNIESGDLLGFKLIIYLVFSPLWFASLTTLLVLTLWRIERKWSLMISSVIILFIILRLVLTIADFADWY